MGNLIQGGKTFGKGFIDALLLSDELIDKLGSYKRRIAGNYRAILKDDLSILPNGGLLVSRKIDGELWFLINWDNQIFLANPKGSVIYGELPLLINAKNLKEKTIIAGELYAKVDGRRSRVGDLAALLADSSNADLTKLCFSAFDIIQGDDISDQQYIEKLKNLNNLLPSSDFINVVQTEDMDREKISTIFESEVATGQIEGLVIRLSSGLIYKLKPSISIDAVIIAYTIKNDQPDLVRSILLGLMHQSGEIQIFGGCGNLGSDEDRKALLLQLKPLQTQSSVRYASESGSLYTFVKPEVVAEIKVTDLQAEHSDGSLAISNLIQNMTEGYKNIGMANCPKPIHPVLTRIRKDKSANPTDIRIEQVALYSKEDVNKKSLNELPKSEVIRREVWTKDNKGSVAVRKLLVWKTNKKEIDPLFPEYVVHWTDFSLGRASPLDRDVKLAPDKNTALKLADGMIEENIKKGWNKIL